MRPKGALVANLLLVLLSLIVGAAALEGAAQYYAAHIAMQGKLFAPDEELGWLPLPDLDLVRRNADGEPWRVITDRAGIRGPASWAPGRDLHMLVLGDSFAFGEGVDLDERFDTLLQNRFANLSVVDLGVMGYGPDQELIRARHWTDQLRTGDIVLILTYSNDFFDLASTTHSGRSKPWLERRGGALIEHRPDIGLLERLRDRSYIFSVVARRLNIDLSGTFEERLKHGGELYRDWLLQETRPLLERGVHVVLVHHGDQVFEMPFDVPAVFGAVCPALTGCLALDPATAARPRQEIFLHDGHWAPGGHRLAAERIGDWLLTLDAIGPRLEPQDGPSSIARSDP
jgi:hypothetical protein